jgi:hypothetical protein
VQQQFIDALDGRQRVFGEGVRLQQGGGLAVVQPFAPAAFDVIQAGAPDRGQQDGQQQQQLLAVAFRGDHECPLPVSSWETF